MVFPWPDVNIALKLCSRVLRGPGHITNVRWSLKVPYRDVPFADYRTSSFPPYPLFPHPGLTASSSRVGSLLCQSWGGVSEREATNGAI